jgi:molybdopterin synthase catalytic subunit
MWRARLLLEPFNAADELSAFLRCLDDSVGGIATFTGLARGRNRDGTMVHSLFLQHHPRFTQRSLDDIARAAADRFDVRAISVVHRAGGIAPGEPIVWVATAAAHRRAAFEAADYLMDRLKTEAMFWKREDGPQGSTWIEPTEGDRRERGRWE